MAIVTPEFQSFLASLPRSEDVANGKGYLRFDCGIGPMLAPCPQHFKGPHGWLAPGDSVCIYHATDLSAMAPS